MNLDPVDVLSGIHRGISQWHGRLGLPTPPGARDFHKAALRQMPWAGRRVAPSIADELSDAVRGWWLKAARVTGWNPEHLIRIRRT